MLPPSTALRHEIARRGAGTCGDSEDTAPRPYCPVGRLNVDSESAQPKGPGRSDRYSAALSHIASRPSGEPGPVEATAMRVVKPYRGNSLVSVHHCNDSLSSWAGSSARPDAFPR